VNHAATTSPRASSCGPFTGQPLIVHDRRAAMRVSSSRSSSRGRQKYPLLGAAVAVRATSPFAVIAIAVVQHSHARASSSVPFAIRPLASMVA
jgi:hypothetical protein